MCNKGNKVAIKIAGAVVSAFCLTFLASQPQVTVSNAQQFFDNYYRYVTQAGQRRALFQDDLTHDFQKSGGGLSAYNSWWEGYRQVVVNQVESVPGNPMEFTVWLTYYPVNGSPWSGVTSFSLVCNGGWASLEARIPTLGCPVNNLQIESGK